MIRHRLTGELWNLIADLCLAPKPTGRPPRARREIVDDTVWVLCAGAPWRDLPEALGPWWTVWNSFDANVVDDRGEPIAWSVALVSDEGCHADWIEDDLLALGVAPVIPSKANECRDARAASFDREVYRNRNIVERLIGWRKESCRVFSRLVKTAKNYAGMIGMAFIHRYSDWLPDRVLRQSLVHRHTRRCECHGQAPACPCWFCGHTGQQVCPWHTRINPQSNV